MDRERETDKGRKRGGHVDRERKRETEKKDIDRHRR
jgi:hypothetical protein